MDRDPLRLELEQGRVEIEVQAEGIFPFRSHARTFRAPLPLFCMVIPGEVLSRSPVALPLQAMLAGEELLPLGEDLSRRDRATLLENLRDKVLALSHYPRLFFSGTLNLTSPEEGVIQGTLSFRGGTFPLAFACRLSRKGEKVELVAHWQGKLRDLSLTPFKGPLGLVWLKDWLKVRVEVEASPLPPERFEEFWNRFLRKGAGGEKRGASPAEPAAS